MSSVETRPNADSSLHPYYPGHSPARDKNIISSRLFFVGLMNYKFLWEDVETGCLWLRFYNVRGFKNTLIQGKPPTSQITLLHIPSLDSLYHST